MSRLTTVREATLRKQVSDRDEQLEKLRAELATATKARDACVASTTVMMDGVRRAEADLAEANARVAEVVAASEQLMRAIADADVGMAADVATDKLIAMTRAYRKAEAAQKGT